MIVGDTGVGKSRFITIYVSNEFSTEYEQQTFEVHRLEREINIGTNMRPNK